MRVSNIQWISIGLLISLIALLIFFSFYNQNQTITTDKTSIYINLANPIINILSVGIGSILTFITTSFWNDHTLNKQENERRKKIILGLQSDLESCFYALMFNKRVLNEELAKEEVITDPLKLFNTGFWDLIKVEPNIIEDPTTRRYLSNSSLFMDNINENINLREMSKVFNSRSGFNMIKDHDEIMLGSLETINKCLIKFCEAMEFEDLLNKFKSLE